MSNGIKSVGLLLLGAAAGAAAMVGYTSLIGSGEMMDGMGKSADEPLYWVAPMDPNYRRDKPGKSPMGMDLVPVFAENNSGPDAGPGTISVSPEVINTLGVRTGKVESKPLNFEIRSVGYVDYDQDRIVHVHPRVEGWIEKLFIKAEGEPVEAGQPVYEIYSPALVNAQEEYVFALARNNRKLIRAARSRLSSLQVPDALVEELRKTRKVSQTVTFYAPQSGVVESFMLRQGMYVKPGMTMLSIGALEEVWVEAQVFEQQAGLVEQGLPVQMTLDYLPGRKWQGEVDYIYPVLDPQTRTLKVRMRFANPDYQLKPNMFAEVVINKRDTDSVLTVPVEALIRGGDGDRVVLALGEGRFKSIGVEAGRTDGDRIEIIKGLKMDGRVVTSAQFLLDSESSKSSDFMRMNNEPMGSQPASVWTEAQVNKVMPEMGKLNLDHGRIEAWKWPAMTMDFKAQDGVALDQLSPGMTVHIEITKQGSDYQVSQIHIPDQTMKSQSMNHEGMNHDGMSQDGMNHEGMSHDGMNHDGMNHEGMNHEGMNHDGMSQDGMNQEGMSHDGMNHDGMNHDGMNHDGMNHDSMSHDSMSHDGMNHGMILSPSDSRTYQVAGYGFNDKSGVVL
ncbi:MAG: efflux RND transporter periplasmic adaptor subunit [Amphritea sp.]|nr:efflux RND transporter periplasmic adaptor subunit [Amphritea sp.]